MVGNEFYASGLISIISNYLLQYNGVQVYNFMNQKFVKFVVLVPQTIFVSASFLGEKFCKTIRN